MPPLADKADNMFKNLFGKKEARNPDGLTLEVNGVKLTFNSVKDFEFAMASRIEVPGTKISQLVKLSDDDLLAEVEGIRDVKRRFVSVLLRSITQSDSISHSLRMLDATLFSNDHGWRQFIAALNANDTIHDAYKRVALVKYLQYLNARHEVVRSIYRERLRSGGGELPEALKDNGRFVQFAQIDESGHMSSKAANTDVTRLPKGEKVPLTVREGDEVYLFLSKKQYRLRRGETVKLIDENGTEWELHPGRNVIGRAPDADVKVGDDRKDISRRHLVIELPDDELALLTDMSSFGTFVPEKALSRRRASEANWSEED